MSVRSDLRRYIAADDILLVAGAADAITARIIQESGFRAVYATGAGFANASFAIPDLGLVTLSDLVVHVDRIVDAIDLPVIVDADTGFGGVMNVYRAVQRLERAGAAAIQIEDQVSPKRCGHFDGTMVVQVTEMVQKVRAAVEARTDPDLVIIIRTDALPTEGFDAAVERARAYVEAGADAIFVEAPQTLDELSRLPALIPAPLIANIVEGGRTPLVDAAALQQMGYSMALFANTALRVSMSAVFDAMRILLRDGGSARLLDRLMSWDGRQALVGLPQMEALEQKITGAASQ